MAQKMQIEPRADGAHITGYVNATEKKSRPVITPREKVIEEIEPRAFEAAIARAGNTPRRYPAPRQRQTAPTPCKPAQ